MNFGQKYRQKCQLLQKYCSWINFDAFCDFITLCIVFMESFKSLTQKIIILLRKMWFFQFRPRSEFWLYIYEKRRISRKPFEIFTWNFKNLLVLVVSTYSSKMNNICDGGCHGLADLTWNDPKGRLCPSSLVNYTTIVSHYVA